MGLSFEEAMANIEKIKRGEFKNPPIPGWSGGEEFTKLDGDITLQQALSAGDVITKYQEELGLVPDAGLALEGDKPTDLPREVSDAYDTYRTFWERCNERGIEP